MDTSRRGIRERREQLLTLINGWDPVGRLAAGAARDEYDRLVDPLLSILGGNPTRERVREFLEAEISKGFGGNPRDAEAFANRALAWYQMKDEE